MSRAARLANKQLEQSSVLLNAAAPPPHLLETLAAYSGALGSN